MSKNKEKHSVHESANGGPDKEDARRQRPDARPEKTDTEENGGNRTQGAAEDETVKAKPAAPAESADLPAMLRIAMQAGQADRLAQLQDRLLRLQADFDNFRKRTLREKGELFESANQALMLELLPVLDHLQLGAKAASVQGADPAFREGLVLIFDQLMGALSKFGLSPIETENKKFDPNCCEAVNAMPSATEPEGKILSAVRRGYMLRNKLLRPAQVIVSSGPPPEGKADDRPARNATHSVAGGRQTTDDGQKKTEDGFQKTGGAKGG